MPPTNPPAELVERFADYYRDNMTWGSMHIVLDDSNLEDGFVEFCIGFAAEHGDTEGGELARILLTLSPYQRYRLARFAERAANRPW